MKNWFSKLLLSSLSLGVLVFPFSIKAEVALSTIAEYKKQIQVAYQLNDEDFK